MIRDLYIENFRGFDKLKIDNIKKINFLVGKNNCGKTSVLESISLMISILNINTGYYINGIRRIKENPEELKNLFHNLNYENTIKLNYTLDTDDNYNLNISPIMKKDNSFFNDIVSLEYNFSIFYKNDKEKQNFKYSLENINEIENKILRYNHNIKGVYISTYTDYKDLVNYLIEILKNKKEKQLLEMISFFNKNIEAINILKNDIYFNINGISELVLLNLMGDGLKKYLSIVLPIVANIYNTILVDEIENGLHHKTIKHLLKSILNLSKNNDIQMFFTTHSYEVLKFLSEIVNDEFKDIKDTVSVINIVNTENKGFQSYNYDIDSVKELLENDSDIRY
ncbi:AAA family ATPase [Brachyspira pilosicoli]|uniref:Predicted ATPase n=1 Tax=Brachyspira pilosicoli (strain ATCC BAA-1826 / 95/1000) TaxID=759914 RepID=D8IBH3_BRAP9|nr:AAA family ATPase [Brachyspira pilosicoli]ADK30496.1 predicted ATPase [Brachyspira pilosicoli 95/1000]